MVKSNLAEPTPTLSQVLCRRSRSAVIIPGDENFILARTCRWTGQSQVPSCFRRKVYYAVAQRAKYVGPPGLPGAKLPLGRKSGFGDSGCSQHGGLASPWLPWTSKVVAVRSDSRRIRIARINTNPVGICEIRVNCGFKALPRSKTVNPAGGAGPVFAMVQTPAQLRSGESGPQNEGACNSMRISFIPKSGWKGSVVYLNTR